MASVTGADCVVVKIGSALLVDTTTGALKHDWLEGLAADVAMLKARGTDVRKKESK